MYGLLRHRPLPGMLVVIYGSLGPRHIAGIRSIPGSETDPGRYQERMGSNRNYCKRYHPSPCLVMREFDYNGLISERRLSDLVHWVLFRELIPGKIPAVIQCCTRAENSGTIAGFIKNREWRRRFSPFSVILSHKYYHLHFPRRLRRSPLQGMTTHSSRSDISIRENPCSR
jgi:hypothetical protein